MDGIDALKPYAAPRTRAPRKRRRVRRWHGVLLCVLFLFYILIHEKLNEEGEARAGGFLLALVAGWSYNTSRDVTQYILTNNSTSLLPKSFCEEQSDLLVIVCTAPDHFEAREAIRSTWGSPNQTGISVFYLMGKTLNTTLQEEIDRESATHSDIIQENFIDSYNNLTLKTVSMLKLVNDRCLNSTQYLFKIDDDMFVNMPRLMATLQARKLAEPVLLGHLICGAKPIKDSSNKWYAPRYMYPGKVYPNYLSGTGYVMSVDIAQKLYETALKTPLFHLEDVYITGICTKLIGVKPQHNPGFTFQKQPYDPCSFKDTITFHKLQPSDVIDHYVTLTTTDLEEQCKRMPIKKKSVKYIKEKKKKCK